MKLLAAGTGVFAFAPVRGLVPVAESVFGPQVGETFLQGLGTFPRNQTVIIRILTGRVTTPDDFNQWVGWKSPDRGLQNLADEPLWSVDFASGKIINGVADGDPKYSPNFTSLTIALRKGVAWSDGEPFTSADVVYTVQSLMKYNKFSGNSFFIDNVAAVTAVDDYTVKFDLKQANSRFHTTFLDRWGCTRFFPKHIFEKQADPTLFKFNPYVGCGPYKLHSFDPQGAWTAWVKRDDWAKTPTGIMYGEPKPQYIIYQFFADEATQILSQSTHQLDYVELSADGLKALLAQSKTSRAYQPTFPFVVNNDPAITGIVFNTARKPFDNLDVRWALLLAIDIVEYTSIAVGSTGTLSPVHIPHLGPYPKLYIEPMQDWLKAFTIDVGNGATFAPYDPTAPQRVADSARSQGNDFPSDAAFIEKTFGLGWYKFAPDIAEKLLLKNGFKRDQNKMWLLPDGTPWKISFLAGTVLSDHGARNAAAAVQQWKKFGIDATMQNLENTADPTAIGDFDVTGVWPGKEPWGAGPDLYRTLDDWNSTYIKPVGQRNQASYASRWSSPAMDAVIKKLRETDPFDTQKVIAIGIEGLKIAIQNMPGIPTYGYVGFIGWDQYYWTNWPGSENAYNEPYTHWPNFKYTTPFLKPTGQA